MKEDLASTMKPKVFRSLTLSGNAYAKPNSESYIITVNYNITSITRSESKIEVAIIQFNKNGEIEGIESRYQ